MRINYNNGNNFDSLAFSNIQDNLPERSKNSRKKLCESFKQYEQRIQNVSMFKRLVLALLDPPALVKRISIGKLVEKFVGFLILTD